MTIIDSIGDNKEHLVDVLIEYEEALKDYENNVRIKGKTIEAANIENPSWQVFYDQKRIELQAVVKYLEKEVARVRSKLYRSYKEGHQRELSEREINRYIDGEDAFLTMDRLRLEAEELYDKYKSVVDAFTARGYALNNITRIRVASMEDVRL